MVQSSRNRHGFFVGYSLDGCCDEFLAGLYHDLDEQQDKYYLEKFYPEKEWRRVLEGNQKNSESTSCSAVSRRRVGDANSSGASPPTTCLWYVWELKINRATCCRS